MEYTGNDCFGNESQQNVSNSIKSDKYNKLALALAAIMGIIGSTAVSVGGSMDIDSLYRMTSVAFPQLTAWLISYMIYQNPNSLNFSNSQCDAMPALSEKSSKSHNS